MALTVIAFWPSAVHLEAGRGRVEGHAENHVVQSQLEEERAQTRNSYAQLAGQLAQLVQFVDYGRGVFDPAAGLALSTATGCR